MENSLKSHFMNLYNMALADDSIKPEELVQIYEIGKRHGILDDEYINLLQSPVDFKAPDTIEEKVEYLYDMVMVIRADGVIDDNEIATLKRYCKKFGFATENIDGIVDFLMEKVANKTSLEEIIKEIME